MIVAEWNFEVFSSRYDMVERSVVDEHRSYAINVGGRTGYKRMKTKLCGAGVIEWKKIEGERRKRK